MDKEVKKFMLNYVNGIDEDIYFNFILLFSNHPARFIKKDEMPVYLKCKLFAKKKSLNTKLNRFQPSQRY